MDFKLIVIAAVALLVFGGAAFAASSWQGAGSMHGFNRTMPDGMNCTGFGRGHGGNFNGTMPDGAQGAPWGNGNDADFTLARANFSAALAAVDYASAKALHEQYGFGGPVFEKLNESTFPKYAEINNLQAELMDELGVTDGPGMGNFGFEPRGFGRGPERGMRRGQGGAPPGCTGGEAEEESG